jgi:hypothetical protein
MSPVYEGRTVFRRGRAVLAIVTVATAIFTAGFVFSFRTLGWGWQTGFFAFIALFFGAGGITETIVERIELQPDAMLIRRLWGTRRVPITDIEKVAEAKGVSPLLILKSGEKVKLPDVGGHLGNSTRAWLRSVSSGASASTGADR